MTEISPSMFSLIYNCKLSLTEVLISECVPGFTKSIISSIFLSLNLAYFSRLCFVFHKVLLKHAPSICVFLSPLGAAALSATYLHNLGASSSVRSFMWKLPESKASPGGCALIICMTLLEEPCLLGTHFELIKEGCG